MKKPAFSRSKFFSLSIEKQHKTCAELLSNLYKNMLKKESIQSLFSAYGKYSLWLKLPSLVCTFEEISNRYHFHAGQAKMQVKEHDLLPKVNTDDHPPEKEFGKICILLDNLRSAHNVGSIIRTTEALRIGKIYFYKNTPYTDNKKVQKTSMDTFRLVECIRDFNLEDLPRPFIGLETVETAKPLHSFSFPKTCTLILGNEEYGICQELLQMIDEFVQIPMLGYKNSLNVACAYAMTCSNILQHQQETLYANC